MRRGVAALCAVLLIAIPALPAQPSDLAASYYHFSLAKLYEGERQFQEAIQEYEKAVELDPASGQLRFELGRALIQASEIRRGVQELEKAIELDPENFRPHLLLGQVQRRYVETGNGAMLDKAVASFKRVLELDDRNPEALYYLGELLLLKGEPAEAVPILNEFNQVRPGFPQGALMEARARLATGDADGAAGALERALEFDSGNPELIDFLGRLYEDQGKEAEALELIEDALERTPTLELRFRAGVLLSRVGRHAEAIATLKAVADEAQDRPLIELELAKAYSEGRDYRRAVEVFRKVLEGDPDNTEANYYMAVALRSLGQRAEAIERVQHLLELAQSTENTDSDPSYQYRLRSLLAVLYQDDRQYDRAVDLFRTLTGDDPDNFRWKLGLIYALKERGDMPEALELSGRLLNDYPDNLDVQITHAQMLSESGRLEEAIRLLESQIERDPLETNYYLAGSQLYSDHKEYRKAEKLLRRGLKAKPESERLIFQVAAMAERQGHIDRAEEGFRQILESNPEHAAVLNYLGYMLADRGVRLQEALGYIEKAIAQDPYNGAYLDSLGWVYYQLNRLEMAETNLNQAAEIDDSDPTIFEHLGDLYLKMGDYSKARLHYQQSVRFSDDRSERDKVERKLDSVNRLLAQEN